jgi:hypothetical protein
MKRRHVAGGYIQFASSNYYQAKRESYAAFAKAMVESIKQHNEINYWEIEFVGQMVNFQFAEEPRGIYPSMVVWFFAAARTPIAAEQSRERLIEAIDEAIDYIGHADIAAALTCDHENYCSLRSRWSQTSG